MLHTLEHHSLDTLESREGRLALFEDVQGLDPAVRAFIVGAASVIDRTALGASTPGSVTAACFGFIDAVLRPARRELPPLISPADARALTYAAEALRREAALIARYADNPLQASATRER